MVPKFTHQYLLCLFNVRISKMEKRFKITGIKINHENISERS